MSDKYGYIGIETLLNYCQNSKDHAITPNEIMRLKRELAPKFTQVAIETDVYWLERQLDMYKEKIYLNEQTMIVYVPFVTAELVEASGGTIQRIGEEE